jgi:hypothetical protein
MLNQIEILALIFIIVGLIKVIVLAYKPRKWMNFAESLWNRPKTMQLICLILAIVIFFYLRENGISIVQILAVSFFVAMFMAVAIAPEAEDLIQKYDARIKRGNLWKQYWLYVLLWLVLLLWGLKEIFMK